LRYWKENCDEPRDIQELFAVLDDLDCLKEWAAQSGSPGEANALKGGNANIAAVRLRRMINEALYPVQLRQVLARQLTLRHTADYAPDLITQTQAARALQRTRDFLDAIQKKVNTPAG
jgi:hypothetical protein